MSIDNLQENIQIPQERSQPSKVPEGCILPISIINKQYENKKQVNKEHIGDKYKQTTADCSPSNAQCTERTINPKENIDLYSQCNSPQNARVELQDDTNILKTNQLKLKFDEEIPFKNNDKIENEKLGISNSKESTNQKKNSFKSIPKSNLTINDSPRIQFNNYAVRKGTFTITTSINNHIAQSNQNRQSIYNDQPTSSQGWIHNQFNPILDTNAKKEAYVIQKMVEFQFDPDVAKTILQQIDIQKYSREEIIQMVCETMLNHRDEQRVGKRVIDRIQSTRFIKHVLEKSGNNTKVQNNRNQISFENIPAMPSQYFQQNQNQMPRGSLQNSVNFNNLNAPSFVDRTPQATVSKKHSIREKSFTKFQNRGTYYLTSQILNGAMTYSQKNFKMENNVPDKIDTKLYPCEICCIEYLGSEFYRLSSCSHNFCMSCAQIYLIEKVNKSEVLNIVCPQQDCGQKIQDFQIQKVLVPELFERYMKFKKMMVLNQDLTVRWCPTKDCETYMRGSKEKPCLECPKCKQKMCFLCNQVWHEGQCEDAMNESLKNTNKKLKIENCPKCKGRIQKFEGCNHMKCWMCSYEFCWLCKSQYSKIHYMSWNILGCPNQMFSDEKLEGTAKACSLLQSVFKLIFFLLLVFIGGSSALGIYICLMFIMALILPILFVNHYFKEKIQLLTPRSKCFLWLILFVLGVFLYPLWLILCYIPGTCIFGPEVYMYILFLIYNEDMYN